MINKCLKIAEQAHEGQRRKFVDEPYVNHPTRMANRIDAPFYKCIALLHDVLEDSDFTASDLLGWGVSPEIVEVVTTLTKTDGESYCEYIIRCLNDIHARTVKILDLKDNLSNLHRGSMRDKYELSLYMLEGRHIKERFEVQG